MNTPVLKRMTADEFVVWAEQQPLGRFELIDGLVVQMNAEQSIHARVKLRAAIALGDALRRSGIQGEVFGDGMAVKISDRLVHEPDTLVRVGPPLDDEAVLVTDPMIVVEVLSPSTGPIDTSVKLANYFSLPSVQHYLVINAKKRIVQHYRRSGGQPVMEMVTSGSVVLDPPGLTLAVADFFSS